MRSLLEKKNNELEKRIEELESLISLLKTHSSVIGKLEELNATPAVKNFLENSSPLRTFLTGLSPECALPITAVIAIGQASVFDFSDYRDDSFKKLREMVDQLLSVENFYEEMGGIVGYHTMLLKLLSVKERTCPEYSIRYHRPQGIDISLETKEVHEAIYWGIKNIGEMAEIYPVGGAADRLGLQDEKTGMALPAAKLIFCGKTLLEGMIQDLQAREYLHYKLFGKQVCTPIAMMTSSEKDNHMQILSICNENKWFGRPENSFRFFCQSSVPVINKEGNWCLQAPLQLLLKPGGHGVIWKLAEQEGVFKWFFSQGKRKALVRQINNPIAGCDYGLLAFTGIGCGEDKVFGFASCPRQIKAMEGVNVLVEKRKKAEYEYFLTNIEYCDFKKFNIDDEPEEKGSLYSKYSSNTNILFIDLNAVQEALVKCPIPGMLLNMKKSCIKDETGNVKEEEFGRLESMMQNIADCFSQSHPHPLSTCESKKIKSFLTYNQRRKTISCVKRDFFIGSSLLETPYGCFLDILHNAKQLLVEYCNIEVPEILEENNAFLFTPSFLFLYHPVLGPLYSVIAQKIQQGRIAQGSELQLYIAELSLEGLDLEGSLYIEAESIMGEKTQGHLLSYSENTGKCILKNLKVSNRGINFLASNVFWKNQIQRYETCRIVIYGNGEFYAENVTLAGDIFIEVQSGTKVVASEIEGKLIFTTTKIQEATWHWEYGFDEEYHIILKKSLREY